MQLRKLPRTKKIIGKSLTGLCVIIDTAEREGFEPSVQLPIQRFSRPSHSTALASLRE